MNAFNESVAAALDDLMGKLIDLGAIDPAVDADFGKGHITATYTVPELAATDA